MDFLILGPLEVRSNGRALDLGGPKRRAVLAVLLLRAGEVVSVDGLIDELWGERPPASAAKLVQGYVSGLRRVVGGVTRTRPPGYALEISPESVDAYRFERLAADGRPHEALALWRGRALENVVLEGPASREAARLDELRLVVAEARIDADLASGRHAELVPELERLVAEHPLRERLHAQLMLALYRSQRQAEALESYRRAHRSLMGELGLDPGRELRDLEQAILRHDPALDPPPPAAGPRRRRLTVALALVALLAVALAATMRGRGSPAPVVLVGDSIAVIEPASGRILDEIPLGGRPSAIAVGEGSVWAANEDADTLVRIDPRTRRVVGTIGLGVVPTDIAVGGGAVWVASEHADAVLRVSPVSSDATARVSFPVPSDANFVNVAARGAAVWVGDGLARLARVDAATGATQRRVLLHPRAEAWRTPIAIGDGVLWVGVEERLVAVDDAGTPDEVGVRGIGVDAGVVGLTLGAGALWLTAYPNPALVQIDPMQRRVAGVIPLAHIPWKVAFGEGYLWVSTGKPLLLRVDPDTREVEEIPLGVYTSQGSGEPIAVGFGAVWVAVRR